MMSILCWQVHTLQMSLTENHQAYQMYMFILTHSNIVPIQGAVYCYERKLLLSK